MTAFPRSDGTYYIDQTSHTYHHREAIKAVGGKWNPPVWILPNKEAAEKLRCRIMTAVKLAPYCHETGETLAFATTEELAKGEMREFCGNCDSWCNRAVILGPWEWNA